MPKSNLILIINKLEKFFPATAKSNELTQELPAKTSTYNKTGKETFASIMESFRQTNCCYQKLPKNRTTSRCLFSVAVKMKRYSINRQSGLGLYWHPTQPESKQLQGSLCELLWKEGLLHHLFGLGLCWHPTWPESEQLQGALCQLLWKAALLHQSSGLGLCWHQSQPEIGPLQGALCQLLWKAALLHQSSGLGLCWHQSQPEIGPLQGALCQLLWKEALLHQSSGLGLCWHQSQPEIGQLQGHHSELLCREASLAPTKTKARHILCVVPWSLLAPDLTRERTTSRCPLLAAMKRGVAPAIVRPWPLLAPDSTKKRTTSRCPS